mmetsp:Transcript_18446/g.52067  ORF Transcript_18446/g.52067 Transcript_18446/m.52067 type:complete len:300 (-) Transcript_18446:60-959(-)|eukprot:CAMPEP_0119125958 /NCGR_PEP_ID=MMETSP1310-20130426/5057_1 /TAXON_ID=464262 /ORGANISM="Genus nov. species nov., Strain RCC2339" /LENGTH=299 /DNA_ID=CAMNT_0007116079 /DNA_START=57 /DNA_END=956 /DNA_ORIENTATION=-
MAEFELGENTYGKENVRFLRVVKDSSRHEIHELTGWSQLEGPFGRSYTDADNSSIVPTETQKNSFYALSKKYPISPMEKWVVLFGKDLMARHAHIQAVNCGLERKNFQRIRVDGREHNHAFQKAGEDVTFVRARVPRNGVIEISAGFKDLQVLKTTQSGFEGFIKDEYTTLQESRDRILSTKVYCEWTYSSNLDLERTNFEEISGSVKERVLRLFAGPADRGVYSASVQKTLYDIGVDVLKAHTTIQSIRFELPNIHYYNVDFASFNTTMTNNNEVFLTFDGAAGLIKATVQRKPKASL